ncbi:hypothetical protein GCM10010964_17020 [Caldovatus sediminis]|jgi:hypothetical protein|uniref:DUF465 domain-containing protein n=1 Tax=Caldovatus sediminis TaxID=2041189 RepID=A0A8J3EDD5_9PROT|nr:YdcH family protein [Caldovatus sediminis]GGG29711.1 hypothetical protein GCM10010964_17020 [Caldovatus sediminis]
MSLDSPARSWLLDRLTERHAELERALAEEMERPRPDEATVRRIKREKLAVRDRIAAIERGAVPPAWMMDAGAPRSGQATAHGQSA